MKPHILARPILFSLVLCRLVNAGAEVPGEWIAVRDSTSHRPWSEIAGELTWRGVLLKTFGPERRFALFRSLQSVGTLPSGIGAVQPNFVYRTLNGGDPDFPKSWGLQNEGQSTDTSGPGLPGRDIGAVAAWRITDGGDAIVALVDTGIDTTHEELRDNLWSDPANGSHGWNVLTGTSDVQDGNGHGTFCAGIIGAAADNGHGSRGVNAKVRLMAVKSFDAHNYGTTADAITAIQFAVEHGARILNLSWGGTGYDQALYDTLKWAGGQGALAICAAGNDGTDNGAADGVTYPAGFRLPNVIAVAAYDNRDRLATWSNFGKDSVDIGAPGVGIFSTTIGGYRWDEGTSFAAAYVSGVAALVQSYVPQLDMTQLRERLLQTSQVIDYYQKERTITAGRIHAYNALADIRPPRPRLPAHWTKTPQNIETPHPYANNAHYSYVVHHDGATHIRVHFSRFSTEKSCDKVTLTDATGRVVFVYSGRLDELTSADALGDTLHIDFVSDQITTDFGFVIDSDEASYDAGWEGTGLPQPATTAIAGRRNLTWSWLSENLRGRWLPPFPPSAVE